MNIFKVEKENYLAYSVGSIPDDVTSMSFPSSTPYTFSITFNKAYSHLWLLYNQLSQITPIPQHVWDKTSASGRVGNYDMTPSGAKEVYKFLNGQSNEQAAYTSNPLWKVVDGPWTLSAFSPSTGYQPSLLTPPTAARAGQRSPRSRNSPSRATSPSDALRSGQLDYGYLPSEDINQARSLTSRGYTIDKWTDFGFNDFFLNFTNPKVGPIFKQLYVRQAMQHLINQPEIANDIFHGAAYPDYGPVPTVPPNPYSTQQMKTNPYPYSVSAAKSLLASHGWTVRPGGTSTCARPGTASNECGTGIAAGAKLSFNELVATGSAPFTAETETMQSSWSRPGSR